jgi:hypothetical protein
MFTKAVCAHFDRESLFLVKLMKLRRIGSVSDFITSFEHLAIKTEGLSDEFYLECFMSGLKKSIRAHVSMHHPTTLLHACRLAREA